MLAWFIAACTSRRSPVHFEITSLRGPGNAGQVFGDLVYHNLWATHGNRRGEALELFHDAVDQYHPGIWPEG